MGVPDVLPVLHELLGRVAHHPVVLFVPTTTTCPGQRPQGLQPPTHTPRTTSKMRCSGTMGTSSCQESTTPSGCWPRNSELLSCPSQTLSSAASRHRQTSLAISARRTASSSKGRLESWRANELNSLSLSSLYAMSPAKCLCNFMLRRDASICASCPEGAWSAIDSWHKNMFRHWVARRRLF